METNKTVTGGTPTMTYRRLRHAAHFIGGGGQDLHEYDVAGSDWRPGFGIKPSCVPPVAEYHVGYIAKDGSQHWVFMAPAPMSEGTCDRCNRTMEGK